MYLKTVSCYADNVKIHEGFKVRVISGLIRVYPFLRDYFIEDMNMEEVIIFDAKVVRLEREKEIYQKCYTGEYPKDWIYNFGAYPTGREFLKRYRNIVSMMRDKLMAKLIQLDFMKVFDETIALMEFCQYQFDQYRHLQEQLEHSIPSQSLNLKNVPSQNRVDLSTVIVQSCSMGDNDPRIAYVLQNLDLLGTVDPEAKLVLMYLFGMITRREFTNNSLHPSDYHKIQDNARVFIHRMVIRRFDYLLSTFVLMLRMENVSHEHFSMAALNATRNFVTELTEVI